jgi:hypothetical protein
VWVNPVDSATAFTTWIDVLDESDGPYILHGAFLVAGENPPISGSLEVTVDGTVVLSTSEQTGVAPTDPERYDPTAWIPYFYGPIFARESLKIRLRSQSSGDRVYLRYWVQRLN